MLDIHGLTHQIGDETILRDLSLTADEGELVCLLGASGAGKSTLLRLIAGLETVQKGDICVDGRSVVSTPTHQRGFGLMFQDFALFPHMTVFDNVAFGLKMDGIRRDALKTRVAEVLALVNMEAFAERRIDGLSGGEQQRVALARSLAPRPRLLLLDEPLGALDATLRDHLMVELRQILKAAGATTLYVTHDQAEAFAMGDRVAIMEAGRIAQVGGPRELYLRPSSRTVAEFLRLDNILPIKKMKSQDEGFRANTDLGKFQVGQEASAILLHPAFLRIVDDSPLILQVIERRLEGTQLALNLEHESGVRLRLSHPLHDDHMMEVGMRVCISIDDRGVIPLA